MPENTTLVINAKLGDTFRVGEALITIDSASASNVKLIVKAPIEVNVIFPKRLAKGLTGPVVKQKLPMPEEKIHASAGDGFTRCGKSLASVGDFWAVLRGETTCYECRAVF